MVTVAALAVATGPASIALAAAGADREAGVRAAAGDGVDAHEGFVRWSSPFLQRNVLEPYLPEGGTARWEVALSYWRADHDQATVFAAGPTLEYALPVDHWGLSFGIQLTVFSDYASENRDLGGPFEFTSHIGARWQPVARWYLGGRVQHTSNAGIYGTNPGVDLFAVELGARF